MFDIIAKLKIILGYIKRDGVTTWQDAVSAGADIVKAIVALFPTPAPVPPPVARPASRWAAPWDRASAVEMLESHIATLEHHAEAGPGSAAAPGKVAMNFDWPLIVADVNKLVADIVAGFFG